MARQAEFTEFFVIVFSPEKGEKTIQLALRGKKCMLFGEAE